MLYKIAKEKITLFDTVFFKEIDISIKEPIDGCVLKIINSKKLRRQDNEYEE